MDTVLYALTAVCVVILVVTVRWYERELSKARRERDAALWDAAANDALLLLADDRVDRAVQHAEDSQTLLSSMIRHPQNALAPLTVLDGGA